MPRPSRPLQRRQGNKEPRQKIFVYCEGTVTEKQYFAGMRSKLRAANVDLRVTPSRGNPYTMVDYAIEDSGLRLSRRESGLSKNDQVWVVFDVEAPRPHPQIDEGRRLARKYGVNLAISNPCFELWLLLHYADQHGYLTTSEATKLLEQHVSGYSKAISYNELDELYGAARGRAVRLRDRHERIADVTVCNPYTNVFELADYILAFTGAGKSA